MPGQYYDAETGKHYNYFRDYDPGLGRYVESDPSGLRGGFNTYLYVAASPESNIDPRGLAQFPFPTPNPIPYCPPGQEGSGCRPIPPEPDCYVTCVIETKGLSMAGGSAAAWGVGQAAGKAGKVINSCVNSPLWLPISIPFALSYCERHCHLPFDLPNPVGFTPSIELP